MRHYWPVIFDDENGGTITEISNQYVFMIKYFLVSVLGEYPQNDNFWFQQDGAISTFKSKSGTHFI